MPSPRPVPQGYEAATPYLSVRGANDAIDFYEKVFDAKLLMKMEHDGKIGHAEMALGGGKMMIADEYPDMGFVGPQTLGGSPVTIHLYVEDVDSVAQRALDNGAKLLRPIEDQFYGDRAGKIEDPFGHQWFIATHKEDVSQEEMDRRAKEIFG